MCGIAGEVTFGRAPVFANRVQRMCDLLIHRGPDEEGYFHCDRAILGVRRLKVIGLANGAQPVYNNAGTVACVFNGEIYNYQALRRELENHGVFFRTETDAEVIVHLYDRCGTAFVNELRGMFAVAIFDSMRNELVLARDRAGKKPLVYSRTAEGGVVFASELGALQSHPKVNKEILPEAIDRFLSYRIIPSPLTIYRDVFKVDPGTVMVFGEGGRETRHCYWRFNFTTRIRELPLGDVVRELRRRLEEAIRIRLQSEVPLGALLSGGLDSSLIVALMAREVSQPFHTFAIGFDHPDFNELGFARVVAEHCGTIHHDLVIPPQAAIGALDGLLRKLGEPFGFPTVIACDFMNRLAREYVTVVLSGDGADEHFGGYSRYKLLADLPSLPERPELLRRFDLDVLAHADGDIAGEYQSILVDGLRDSLKERLYSSKFLGQLPASFPVNYLAEKFSEVDAAKERLERVFEVDCNFWLRDAQLVKIDIASMANSVELRCPFLDLGVVELATSLSIDYKLVNGSEKVVLKELAGELLPDLIVQRPKKELALPIESWLSSMLRDEMTSVLLSERSLARSYFDPDRLRRFVSGYTAENGYAIWTLYVLEKWHLVNGL